ncbi:MAG TPA: response regulator transcription factor [Anaerolineales bacterium]|nr:response regulator transcription factor [Anaerolineales bacterium]
MITVILADDHTVLRDGLRFLLEAAGDIQILSMAANGQEAVDQATLHCPDVIVMDISMPIMSGIEATKHICKVCENTKVAILSMHHTTEYIQRALEAGAVGYLLKDSAGAELVAAIRALHDGKRYLSKKVAGTITEEMWSRKKNDLNGLIN